MTKIWDDAKDANFKGIVNNLKETRRHIILCAKHIGSWPTIRGTTVTGTVLMSTEFCVLLCASYNVNPPNIKKL